MIGSQERQEIQGTSSQQTTPWPEVQDIIVKFSSLQQNTSQKQLKRGRIYFGSNLWDTAQHSKNIFLPDQEPGSAGKAGSPPKASAASHPIVV